jgi:hypothetical protein
LMKMENKQREFNKRTLNEDAQFKMLAFNAARERKLEGRSDDPIASASQTYNFDSWEEFYKSKLKTDAQKPAREINPDDFVQKKPWEYTDPSAKFKNKKEREQDYFADHSLYLENKKEQ